MTDVINIVTIVVLLVTCAGLIWTDLRSGLLPDGMNALVAISGFARLAALTDLSEAMSTSIAAVAVGVALLLLRRIYAMARGRQGLGLGDVKFLMAATFWAGLPGLPILLLVATMAALAAVLALAVMGRRPTGQTALPFGPFLVLGLLAVLALEATGSELTAAF
ncbi:MULTISPECIES: prepilin peptidase [unclassified Bradyrhizobium]|uniref:prepilin peptidase n=1 Tax=unclassified Bradyrhizobium TaxID=2631580 RepID=UPI0028EE0215|nr:MULTISPECIES: prepilin peptidase [unclassified Bradyrhizobium]